MFLKQFLKEERLIHERILERAHHFMESAHKADISTLMETDKKAEILVQGIKAYNKISTLGEQCGRPVLGMEFINLVTSNNKFRNKIIVGFSVDKVGKLYLNAVNITGQPFTLNLSNRLSSPIIARQLRTKVQSYPTILEYLTMKRYDLDMNVFIDKYSTIIDSILESTSTVEKLTDDTEDSYKTDTQNSYDHLF